MRCCTARRNHPAPVAAAAFARAFVRGGNGTANAFKTSIPINNMTLSFAPETKAANPPGALCAGQRPDKALNNAQFAAARQARADGTAKGLTGRDLEVFVCEAAMRA